MRAPVMKNRDVARRFRLQRRAGAKPSVARQRIGSGESMKRVARGGKGLIKERDRELLQAK